MTTCSSGNLLVMIKIVFIKAKSVQKCGCLHDESAYKKTFIKIILVGGQTEACCQLLLQIRQCDWVVDDLGVTSGPLVVCVHICMFHVLLSSRCLVLTVHVTSCLTLKVPRLMRLIGPSCVSPRFSFPHYPCILQPFVSLCPLSRSPSFPCCVFCLPD